jgi:hypothetical protein
MTAQETKRLQEHLIARQLLTRHDHPTWTRDQLTRENCGACVLNGYHPKGEPRTDINYAGWARVYVQAGKTIPSNLFMAFLAELASDNRAYANALLGDIEYFGIKADGRGKAEFLAHVNNLLDMFKWHKAQER